MEVLEGVLAAALLVVLAGIWRWLGQRGLRRGAPEDLWLVIPARGSGEELEARIRWWAELGRMGVLRCPAVIADCGLDPLGRELALRLALRWTGTYVWPASALEELVGQPEHTNDL